LFGELLPRLGEVRVAHNAPTDRDAIDPIEQIGKSPRSGEVLGEPARGGRLYAGGDGGRNHGVLGASIQAALQGALRVAPKHHGPLAVGERERDSIVVLTSAAAERLERGDSLERRGMRAEMSLEGVGELGHARSTRHKRPIFKYGPRMQRLALTILAASVVSLGLFATACSSAPPLTEAPKAPDTTATATPHAGTFEEFPSMAGNARAYLALPKGGDKHPAILVIQEWWGLNDWIQTNADRFAEQGYVAYAVDLYRGRVANNPDSAHELMRGLPEDRGVADLQAAFARLAARPDVDPARIGAVGWCMGGGYSLLLATKEPRLKAAVINYGHLVSNPDTIKGIKPTLLGNFAEKDEGIPPNDVQAFGAALTASGHDADFQVFPGVGHAFMNPNNKKGYNEAAAKGAWARIDAFFDKQLKAGK
jgi:carboxymethylenebutenolidase